MKVIVPVVSSLFLSVVLGCVEGKTPTEKFHSRMHADPVELSAFLPNHELLEKQPNTFPFHYFYLKDNGKRYERVYVAPVDIGVLRESGNWAKFDQALAGSLLRRNRDFRCNVYRKNPNKEYGWQCGS